MSKSFAINIAEDKSVRGAGVAGGARTGTGVASVDGVDSDDVNVAGVPMDGVGNVVNADGNVAGVPIGGAGVVNADGNVAGGPRSGVAVGNVDLNDAGVPRDGVGNVDVNDAGAPRGAPRGRKICLVAVVELIVAADTARSSLRRLFAFCRYSIWP
jgi:hypothetical protein